MSHFSSIKTALTDKDFLIQALRGLGYSPDEGVVFARGYEGSRTRVDIRVPINATYDLGFRKIGCSYELVADWFGIREVEQQSFLEHLTRQYAYCATRHTLQQQGYELAHEEFQKDGSIHLVLRRDA